MSGRYLTDLAEVVRAAGLACVEQDGWEQRARSSGGYASGRPTTVMVHHTASTASPADDAHYMSYGSSDRPLANLMLTRDGEVWVLAAGATNTNGKGGPWGQVPQDSMNTYAIGIEACNDGVGEPWSAVQQDAYIALAGALCLVYGISDVCAHYEWAPDRKIDPAGPSRWGTVNASGSWNMNTFRADVRAYLSQGGDDMPDEQTFKRWVRDVLNEATGFGQPDWASTVEETLAITQDNHNALVVISDQIAALNAELDADDAID